MNSPIIEIKGLHKYYAMDGVQVHALRGIDLVVNEADFLAIMGPSGSGKSTLMNILGCLDIPDEGSYRLNGKDVTHMDSDDLAILRNREIGFVFQSFNLLSRTSAIENVETPLIYAGVNRKRSASVRLHCCSAWGLVIAFIIYQTSCPVGSSSGSPSHVRWSLSRPCCWPTNPQATWTPRPVRKLWIFSAGSTRRRG